MATAKELAGDKNVAVNGGQMARQCLEAGLLDEVGVELVPVVLGGGAPLFAELGATPVQLEGPIAVIEGTGVTHCATGSRSRPLAPRLSYWRTRQAGPLRGPAGARGNVRPAMGNRTNRVVVRSLAEFCLALDAALAVAIVMVLR